MENGNGSSGGLGLLGAPVAPRALFFGLERGLGECLSPCLARHHMTSHDPCADHSRSRLNYGAHDNLIRNSRTLATSPAR